MEEHNTQAFVGKVQDNTESACILSSDTLYYTYRLTQECEMNNSEILAGLDEKEAMLMVHIERLKLDIESIKRTKLIFSGDSESQIEMKSIIETPTNSKIKPTQAIREMFDTYPDRKWFPGQIRDRLETMRDADKLNSNYENLLYAVHSILREMTKRGEIDKSEPDKNKRRWYKKK